MCAVTNVTFDYVPLMTNYTCFYNLNFYRYISEEMSIDIFANCYYKFLLRVFNKSHTKLICELNRWKREELNNKQIDTFQSSGASFDEQFICDTHQRWTKEWISVEEF